MSHKVKGLSKLIINCIQNGYKRIHFVYNIGNSIKLSKLRYTALLFLLCLFCGVKAEAQVLYAIQSGNLSNADCWGIVRSSGMPTSYSNSNVLNVTNVLPRQTATFGLPTSTHSLIGCAVYTYGYNLSATTVTITCTLFDGTVGVATMTAQYAQTTSTQNATTNGWFMFDHSTFPYTPGNTDVDLYYKLTSNSATVLQLRYNTATIIAYCAVMNATAPVSNGDCLIISAKGTNAGTISTTTITVDTSVGTLGTTTQEAIQISNSGISYSTSQVQSTTITVSNNIRMTSSWPDSFAWEMGTSLNPLTSSYVQTVVYDTGTAVNRYFVLCDQSVNNFGRVTARHPTRISIYGNYLYNQTSTSSWKSQLANSYSIGATSLTFTTDMGLKAGDVLYLAPTTLVNTGEVVTVNSYSSSASSASITPLLYAHSSSTTGGYVYNLRTNARIDGSASGKGAYFISTAGDVSERSVYLDISHLSLLYAGYWDIPRANSTSSIYHVRIASSPTSITYTNTGFCTMNYCLFNKALAASVVREATKFRNCSWLGNGTVAQEAFSANNIDMEDCEEVSGIMYPTGHASRYIRHRVYNKGVSIYPTGSTLDSYFEDLISGSPVAGTYDVMAYANALARIGFVNPTFNGTTAYWTEFTSASQGTKMGFQKINGDETNLRLQTSEGFIRSCGAGLDDTTTKTSGQICLSLQPYSSQNPYTPDPVYFDIEKPVSANSTVSWYGYLRKNTFYDTETSSRPTVTLTSSDTEINTSYTMTDVDDTWEFFSLAGQVGASPTTVKLKVEAYSFGTGAVSYFADSQLVIGNVTNGTASGFKVGTLWKNGFPTADDLLGGTVDSSFLQTSCENAIDAKMTAISTTTANANWERSISTNTSVGTRGYEATQTNTTALAVESSTTTIYISTTVRSIHGLADDTATLMLAK